MLILIGKCRTNSKSYTCLLCIFDLILVGIVYLSCFLTVWGWVFDFTVPKPAAAMKAKCEGIVIR